MVGALAPPRCRRGAPGLRGTKPPRRALPHGAILPVGGDVGEGVVVGVSTPPPAKPSAPGCCLVPQSPAGWLLAAGRLGSGWGGGRDCRGDRLTMRVKEKP